MHYALIDWDNTLHRGYTIYGLADHLVEQQLVSGQLLLVFKELEHQYLAGTLPYADYTERTCASFAKALAGCSFADYVDAVRSYRPLNEAGLFPDAYRLFQLLNKYGIRTYLVSGAPLDLLETYRDQLGLRDIFAFQLKTAHGRITGQVAQNYGLNKERILRHASFQSLDSVHLLSMGDAVADIPLLNNSLIPIVVGKHDLTLRPELTPIRFTRQEWNLELVEERIRQVIEQPINH
ncbi:haloacid dehalogenase-like hydrolase [Paenibacillus sp. GCM10012307]|uniref:Haloacid dehalogenase-like hydrolase n=1 Tax=Paenibacillus roseus TaxID=2798579 RepID=A0A934J6D6_9BACL|nr:HAD family hydrolase [Paenibacillus roseus]MBJ6362569.1 haloacid dehalogenase-like hydrolase [Paenibacillus roseus]